MENFFQSRGGPAAALSRKIPNGAAKSAYEDLFGGRLRYSGPFSPRVADYGEIFGGLDDSCSIPVLDLPPEIDGGFGEVVRSSDFDYFEIFGGLDTGSFSVSYEDLFVGPRGLVGEPSVKGRDSKDTVSEQHGEDLSRFHSEGPNKDHVSCPEKDRSSSGEAIALSKKDQFSSNEADHSNDGCKQFDMPYNMSSQRSREVAVNGNTKGANPPILESNGNIASEEANGTITEEQHFQKIVLPFPSFTRVKIPAYELKDDQKQSDTNTAFENSSTNELYNSCFSSNLSTSSGCKPLSDHPNNNLSPNADFSGRIMEGIQCRKTVPPFPSCTSMKNSGNDLKTEQKQSSVKCTSSNDAPENKKCHSCSSKNLSASSANIYFPDYSTNDLSSDANSDSGIPEVKQFRKNLTSPPSFTSAESSGNDLKADQNKLTSICTNLEDPPANEKFCSHSGSNHSGSTWDRSYPGGTFLTTYDINLRTQPSQLEPPPRPPPKLARHRHPKIMMATGVKFDLDETKLCSRAGNHQRTGSGGAFDTNPLKESAMDNSPHLFDVEVDASSVAAASAAAIKEAIEQAQARLKSAKESMERKKNNFQRCKKMGSNEGLQCKDKKEDKKTQEANIFNEEIVEETCGEKPNSLKAASTEEKNNKSMREVGFTQELEEKGRHLELTEESLKAMQGKGCRPTQVFCEKDERAEEWKVEKQYYDLISNEKKFKRFQEISQQDICKKKSEETVKVNENDQIEKKSDSVAPELKMNVKLLAVNEAHKQEDKDRNLKEANVINSDDEIKEISNVSLLASVHGENMNNLKVHEAHELKMNVKLLAVNEAHVQEDEDRNLKEANVINSDDEIKEISKVSLLASVHEENMNSLKEVLGVFHGEKNEKELKVPEVHNTVEEKNMRIFDEAYGCKGSSTNVKAANEVCECQEVCGTEEEEKKPRASEEGTNNCNREVGENKFKMANKAFEVDVNGIEVLMNQMSCEEGLEMRSAQKVSEDDDFGRTVELAKEAYCCEEKETKLAEARVVVEQEESKKVDAKEENCKWVENEKKLKVVQEPYHQQENASFINVVQEALGYNENEQKMEEETEACQRDSKDKLPKVTCQEIQQNVEKQKVSLASCELDNFEYKVMAYQGDLEKMKDENIKEVKVPLNSQESSNISRDTHEIYKRTEKEMELEKMKDENIKEVEVPLNSQKSSNISRDTHEIYKRTEKEKELENFQEANLLEELANMPKRAQESVERQDTEGTGHKIPYIRETEEKIEEERSDRQRKQEMEWVRKLEEEKERQRERELKIAQESAGSQDTEGTVHKIADIHKTEEKIEDERTERQRKQEMERLRKLEEGIEREREREKDRLAVEKATHEARERAFSEARERAERVAVERVTFEARQRALAEAREKAEKASAEAFEKLLAEKASREARLKAERAAVERATAEARGRAVEKAIAEKASQDARERASRSTTTSRDRQRKENAVEGNVSASAKEHCGMRQNSSFSDMRDNVDTSQFPSTFSSNGKTGGSDGESVMRCKARLERHERTVERAAKALAEKNMRDILAQREQAERNRLAETLDADVKRWSNGKEGNLRALLSTLQYILGPESGWQPIPLTDIITAAAVKKTFRKATLFVHPDKLQQRGASIQQKYVCEKVFDLLKEAWNRFNSEER